MANDTRFECASSSLPLGRLLSRARRVLWAWLAIGIGAHLAVTQLPTLQAERLAPKPLTTHFVKRQPRLTKPLELKKRPEAKRRRIQRKMVAVKARMQAGRGEIRFRPADVLRGFSRPSIPIGRAVAVSGAQVDPESMASAIQSSKEDKYKIDMSLEMLDLDALDTGGYHALVVQCPADKREIRGFCRLAVIFSPEFYRNEWGLGTQYEFKVGIGFGRLVRYVNQATDIKAEVLGRVRLHDKALFRVPWALFSPAVSFELSEVERRNLGAYLLAGGFIFADGLDQPTAWYGSYKAAFVSLRRQLLSSLKTQGLVCSIERLPNSHPIYHCYFDFDGPAMGCDVYHSALHRDLAHVLGYAEGIEAKGRLLAFVTGKDYAQGWNVIGGWGLARNWDPTPSFRFGTNTIIFALTQEGSSTHRVMDSIDY